MARSATYEKETWEKYHRGDGYQHQQAIHVGDPPSWLSPGALFRALYLALERKYTEYQVKRDGMHTGIYESMLEWPWLRVFATVILAYSLFVIIRRGVNYMRQ